MIDPNTTLRKLAEEYWRKQNIYVYTYCTLDWDLEFQKWIEDTFQDWYARKLLGF